nr:PIN domain-containing protein [Cytophagales bacterium]
MNGNSIVLDTNIVLYLLSGDEVITNLLFNKKLYVSFITQLELLGYSNITLAEQQEIRGFLAECIIIDINDQIKEAVIVLKQKYRLKLPDGIILGTSIYLGLPVISADGGFKRVEEAEVVYYERS